VVRRDGEIVWRSTTTAFKRHPDAARGPSEDDRLPTDGETWQVPEDTGRRYARISRNFDPIHLSAWTARPFGYQRAVVHGMWTVARCVAALKPPSGPALLDVAFKRPLFLPSTVVFVHEPGDVIPFAVVAPETGKPYVEGRVAAR
jgi:acyl dehydratase